MIAAKLDASVAPWLAWPASRQLVSILTDAGHNCWFVGGAVRDSLIGRPVSDIDLATDALPQAVQELISAHGLQVIPTGIDHGTVTVVASGRTFEVTTLRRDVATDGRRATVAYSADWREDALRRDFTLNALYAQPDGVILDCVGGLADLEARRVRFIGDAQARIREDALRILRFYRFSAIYGGGDLDQQGHAACMVLKSALKALSRERVRQELGKLLGAADPMVSIEAMVAGDVLQQVLPEAVRLDRLRALIRREQIVGDVDADRRLAALVGGNGPLLDDIGRRLRFSNATRKRLTAMAADPTSAALPLIARLYRLGSAGLADNLLLHGDDETWQTQWQAARNLVPPRLPITGQQLLDRGIAPGPQVSQFLRQIEQAWLSAGCPAGEDFAELVDRQLG
jgi:poly(A) polymerase